MKTDHWTPPKLTEKQKKELQAISDKGQKEYYESKKSGDYTGD